MNEKNLTVDKKTLANRELDKMFQTKIPAVRRYLKKRGTVMLKTTAIAQIEYDLEHEPEDADISRWFDEQSLHDLKPIHAKYVSNSMFEHADGKTTRIVHGSGYHAATLDDAQRLMAKSTNYYVRALKHLKHEVRDLLTPDEILALVMDDSSHARISALHKLTHK